MKKIVVLAGILLFCPFVASAQNGLNVRDSIASVTLGGGVAVNTIEGYDWGDKGAFAYGGQIMTIVSSRVGLGLEVNGNTFATASNLEHTPYGLLNTDVRAKMTNVMISGRYYLSAIEKKARVYIPVGIGVGFSDINMKTSLGGYSVTQKESSTGFAWYVGFGFEEEVRNNIILGMEAKVNGNHVKVDALDESYHPAYVTVAARIGYKF